MIIRTYSSFSKDERKREEGFFLFRIDQRARSSARKNRNWIFRSVHAPLGFAAPRGVVPFASISRAGGEYANTSEIKETVAPSCRVSWPRDTPRANTQPSWKRSMLISRGWWTLSPSFELKSRLKRISCWESIKRETDIEYVILSHSIFERIFALIINEREYFSIEETKECQTDIHFHVK